MAERKLKSKAASSEAPDQVNCPGFVDWPVEASRKKHPAIQAGIAAVGPNKLTETIVPPTGQGVVKVAVGFPSAFECVPIVTVNALDQAGLSATAQDTFAVSLAAVSQTGFTAKVWRIDQPGGETGFSAARESLAQTSWGQNLRLSWTAIAPRHVCE